ncbi:hypothetical protein MPTK1_6g18620 [Marchantia polymorpha subsp. ruderalis]|uniref:WW domain-containing protein n=2 Tax=Marchantia polymorpha TaxID=3197 RepID=A0AAF6BTI0_MARPO|nr:hypothetical protein MARPO_0038s0072 [Marchantia polymorpha]BBN15314.1 hypothetical protein Mp_6g18620 [Marchantia polymorpha subsp. ruderalis]|eukprot:PTQ40747.1 hypothetical protein MARPO_0038s0072 [Marchantia polymorpha]
MMNGQLPRLSYSQLFSFQVAHNLVAAQQAGERYHVNISAFKDLLKKGEWNRSILEVDFTNGMIFLQDKDKIIAAQPFSDFKKFVVSGEEFEDNLVSIRFTGQQWQIMTQNSAEKACLLHLLQCVSKDTSAEEALTSANPGTLGLNKSVLRAGILIRKARTQFKKDERYCVLVPGKLFMFKNPNLPGQHVRYVTSLMGASVRMLRGLEFELLVPGTKTLSFIPENVEEATGWMGALERSVEIAQQLLAGQPYEQPDQNASNMYPGMNPGMNAGMMPGMSGGGGGFIQSSNQNFGAYTNPQDSRNLQQRIMGGMGGGFYQSSSQGKPLLGVTTHVSNSTPFGVTAPYTGNFQAAMGQGGGNFQNSNNQPQGNVGFQRSPGMLQQLGPSTSMQGQGGVMGQNIAGPSTSYNQPQGNFNVQTAYNTGMTQGAGQGLQQGWSQGQQNQNVPPGETGVRMIRRATQTLREFNNNMDQFLATPSSPGYSGAAPQSQNSGYGGASPQAQGPGYGRGAPQTQFQGYGGPQQAQGPGYGRGAPQAQVQGYGRGGPQAQNQGFVGAQQGQVQGYGGGAPQAQNQGFGGAQQAPAFGGGAPQMQAPGYGRGVPQMQSPGYGRGAPQMQNPGYGRSNPMVPNQGPRLQQQFQGPQPGISPASTSAEWREFTSPDGRTYYYNESTKQTTWTRPY